MRYSPRVAAATLAVPIVFLVPAAHAAKPLKQAATTTTQARHDNFPLHPGSRGPRVAGLQWLLSGHRPNVYTKIKPTLKHYTPGIYGARTKAAVLAYKFRLGYPKAGQCGYKKTLLVPTVTPWFFQLLEGKGKVTRSPCWIALSASRVASAVVPGITPRARAWKQLLVGWLGIQERPDGSNRGPCISLVCTRGGHTFTIQAATGAFAAAWCVSTQQAAAAIVGYGHFADDTAGVYYAADYAAARHWLQAKPKVGALVAFISYDSHGSRISGTGHMGFVSRVTASGFAYIAGNDANGVHERWIDNGGRPYAFIYLPGVAE